MPNKYYLLLLVESMNGWAELGTEIHKLRWFVHEEGKGSADSKVHLSFPEVVLRPLQAFLRSSWPGGHQVGALDLSTPSREEQLGQFPFLPSETSPAQAQTRQTQLSFFALPMDPCWGGA